MGLVQLGVYAVFMLIAGVGSLAPHVVKDRFPEQFRPLWRRLFGQEMDAVLADLAQPDAEWQLVPDTLAVASQWVIGLSELTIGGLASGAVVLYVRGRRRAEVLAGISLCGGAALFGTFMVVLFYLHEANLPKWNQYPAVLVWIGVVWWLLRVGDGGWRWGWRAAGQRLNKAMPGGEPGHRGRIGW